MTHEFPSPQTIEVPNLEKPIRVDKFIAEALPFLSRNQWEKRKGRVFLLNKELKKSFKVSGGEVLSILWEPEVSSDLASEEMPLNILWEDSHVLVVNKPRGLVVHPAPGHASGTLVNGILHYISSLKNQFSNSDYSQRPGIVHRLDKDTTGTLICAKDPQTLEVLGKQFRDKTTKKVYWAVLKGILPQTQGTIKNWIARDTQNRQKFKVYLTENGKTAWTDWKVLDQKNNYTLVAFFPRTGRTHQLRVHSLFLKTPILGDPIYGKADPIIPLMLHARSLTILLPQESESRTFTAPFPQDFLEVSRSLGFHVPE